MKTQTQTGNATEHGEAAVLDLEHLARCSQGDQALESELLTLYIEQARQQMRLVNGAQDSESFKRALHTLKGAALSLGVSRVAATAARLEGIEFDRASLTARAMLATLESDVEAAENCIRRHLARTNLEGISALP
ncbi:MAG: Hpt domain-containing protein [Pseudomonadota bacterium]|nr:Hpt domain-containing protein [Pseudomonadota bacterium]